MEKQHAQEPDKNEELNTDEAFYKPIKALIKPNKWFLNNAQNIKQRKINLKRALEGRSTIEKECEIMRSLLADIREKNKQVSQLVERLELNYNTPPENKEPHNND